MKELRPEDIAEMVTENVSINNGLAIPGVPKGAQPKLDHTPKWQQEEDHEEIAAVSQIWKSQQEARQKQQQLLDERYDRAMKSVNNSRYYDDTPTRVPLIIPRNDPYTPQKSVTPPADQIAINFKGSTILVNSSLPVVAESKPTATSAPLRSPKPAKRVLNI